MVNRLIKSTILALSCLTIVLAPGPASAQSTGVSIDMVNVSTLAISPGGAVGISALVVNRTSSRFRGTVTLTLNSPCVSGTSLGYSKVVLSPGQGMWVTLGYNVPATACSGTYVVTAAVAGGGKSAATSSTAGSFTVL
jgi:hypothetical protein